jgi:hypothetical protein
MLTPIRRHFRYAEAFRAGPRVLDTTSPLAKPLLKGDLFGPFIRPLDGRPLEYRGLLAQSVCSLRYCSRFISISSPAGHLVLWLCDHGSAEARMIRRRLVKLDETHISGLFHPIIQFFVEGEERHTLFLRRRQEE